MASSVTAIVTAAHRLVQALAVNDVTHVFCVPGESYLAVLDALVDFKDRIQVITCRHEAGAANMAVAYAKLTGKPGICFVTRGPGATHASIGIHTASQDSAPLIVFVGQVPLSDRGREGFQELDYPAVFGSMTKLTVEVTDENRMVEIVTRAFATAMQGRHGPVVIALPEDVLSKPAALREPIAVHAAAATLPASIVETIRTRIERATQPLVILGGTGWNEAALTRFTEWAASIDLPIALSWRRKDLIDNDHPCYVGDLSIRPSPGLHERIKAADLIIAIGTRLGDIPTLGYELFTSAEAVTKLIHLHPSAEDLNRVWQASLTAIANEAHAAVALSTLTINRRFTAWRLAARADYERAIQPTASSGPVNLAEIFTHMAQVLPADAILANGAGNYAAWPNRFYRYRRFRTQLAPTSGAMGFGFPAGIAAKILYPQREVIAIAGDGCFLMTGQELATAVQYNVKLVTLIIDNDSYGTIRMHQEREYPGRVMATELRNPDFAAYAKAFGAWSATVERTEEFAFAFATARTAGAPAVIHIKTNIEDILPGQRLSALKKI